MINAFFVVLQPIPPLCDYKVRIDNERGLEVISSLCSITQLNMMEEQFRAHRMVKHQHAAYFAMHREIDCEQDKKK
jgi:hypothetical protein